MDVHAFLRSLRISPRKVRLVIDAVRGKSAKDAGIRLSLMNKGAALPVLKLLRSAIANAEHNFKMSSDSLYIKSITADGGPTLKRSRPRAFGRSAPIRKRTTHISIVLGDRAEMVDAKKKSGKKVEQAEKTVRPKKTSSLKA